MRLTNHIAFRFLTDETFHEETMECFFGKDWMEKPTEDIIGMYDLSSSYFKLQPNKTYYITDTVIDKLDMLKVKKDDKGRYNWTVFSDQPDCKKTFIFNGNRLLRMVIYKEQIVFLYISMVIDKGRKNWGLANRVAFFVNRATGEQCDHFAHPDVKQIETLVYKLLCFIFLSENTEEVIQPGRKTGTQKSGKFINELNIPVTMVTSKWKVTVIRQEAFDVSGHFRLQPHGQGLKQTKMIFIEPFVKTGYKRTY